MMRRTRVGRTDQAETQDLTQERRRLRRLRTRLHAAQQAYADLEPELLALQRWSLDVFPEHPVPDDLRAKVQRIRELGLTFLTEDQLCSLASCALEAEATGREGIMIEAGTARGGSAITLALAKAQQRELQVFDVFGMIPPPTDEDGEEVAERYTDIAEGRAQGRAGDVYYGYRDNLLDEVEASFATFGVPIGEHHVSLVPGLFQDTVTGTEPVALAHVDGDWFESTMTCLENIAPRLVPGGRLVVDDYHNWTGCKKAVDRYFANRPGYRLEIRAKVHVVRERNGDL